MPTAAAREHMQALRSSRPPVGGQRQGVGCRSSAGKCRGPRRRKGRPQGVPKGREYRTERERGRNGPALQGPGWHYAGRTQAANRTVRSAPLTAGSTCRSQQRRRLATRNRRGGQWGRLPPAGVVDRLWGRAGRQGDAHGGPLSAGAAKPERVAVAAAVAQRPPRPQQRPGQVGRAGLAGPAGWDTEAGKASLASPDRGVPTEPVAASQLAVLRGRVLRASSAPPVPAGSGG